MSARGRRQPHPGGWCSWYYYFTKVTEKATVMTNLAVLAADGRDGPVLGCEDAAMVDDGHQSAMATGSPPIARSSRAAWPTWRPASGARASTPRPLVGPLPGVGEVGGRRRPPRQPCATSGRPILGLINPGWGLTAPMRVLDTTHPEVLEHLAEVARTIGSSWGYRIKLDFLYAAALPGVRHDRGATRAQACGGASARCGRGPAPAGSCSAAGARSASVGVVDAMRIGADVTPSWTSLVGRTVGKRSPRALDTARC